MAVDFGAHPMILGGRLNLNSLDRDERRKSVDVLAAYFEQAAEIKARRFVILSGPDPGEAKREEATKALVESLRSLCRAAAEYEMSVVLETFDRKVDKKALIGPAAEAAVSRRSLNRTSRTSACCIDMGHMLLLDEKPMTAINLLKEHLVHVHAGNAVTVPGRTSYGDLHPRFGFPGGENDVPELVEFLEALFQTGYLRRIQPADERPNVGFEIRPQPGETSATILANIKRTWSQAWPRISSGRSVQEMQEMDCLQK